MIFLICPFTAFTNQGGLLVWSAFCAPWSSLLFLQQQHVTFIFFQNGTVLWTLEETWQDSKCTPRGGKISTSRPFKEGLLIFRKLRVHVVYVKYSPKHGYQNPIRQWYVAFFVPRHCWKRFASPMEQHWKSQQLPSFFPLHDTAVAKSSFNNSHNIFTSEYFIKPTSVPVQTHISQPGTASLHI